MQGAFEHLQDLAFAGESLEQLAQAVEIRQVLHPDQPGLPGHQHVLGVAGQRLVGQFQRLRHQRFHFLLGAAQFGQQHRPRLRQRAAGVVGVQMLGDALQLAGFVAATGVEDPVLHIVVGEHQDRQYPLAVQRHEIHVLERELLALGHADHADEMGHRRHQLRRAAQQALGAGARRQFRAQPRHLAVGQRLDLQQAVDEHPVALRSGHAAGRGVRRRQQAHVLQLGQDVADRGRADIQPRVTGQGLRPHGLAVADVARDQRPQQQPRARIEKGVGGTIHAH